MMPIMGKRLISVSNAYLVGVGRLEEYGQAGGEERGGNVVHHGAVGTESLIFFFKKASFLYIFFSGNTVDVCTT